ncbi:MAG: glycosyltransferase family 4 protein [Calditrichaeota bacterium]|nr:glycosyltransferase family 4 protein [Calditrichota bacterium]
MFEMFFAEAKRIDVFPLPRTHRCINILEVCFHRQLGERELQLIHMGQYLKERGHVVLSIAAAGSPLEHRLQEADLPVEPIATAGLMGVPRTVWRLANLIRNSHADVVRVHRPGDLIPAILAKKLAGFGKVVWQVQPGDIPDLSRAYRSWWLSQVDAILVPTRQLASQIREAWPHASVPLFHLPPGVDLRRFYPNAILRDTWREYYGIQPHEVVIGMAVSSAEWHPHVLFLEAAALVSRKLPGLRFVLLLETETPSHQHVERLRTRVFQQGLQEMVVVCRQERERYEQTNVFDVFIQLGTGDIFPRRLLEAMACGAVPIGSNSGCIPEIIEHNRNGLLVPPDNAPALANAMFKLAGDAGKRKRLAREARQMVEVRFNLMHHLEQLEHICYEILKI